MNLKAIIIDDEKNVALTLNSVIHNSVDDIDVVEIITEPVKAPGLIRQHKPDLVFIDIEMPIMNGFDVLDCVKDIDFKIIFVTAYDHYGIQAIKNNAFDYIVKPIKIGEVVQAIEKVRQNMNTKAFNNVETQLESVRTIHHQLHKIKIPTLAGIHFISISDIIRVEASGSYCEVFCCGNSSLLINKSISEVEKIFNADVFYRTHRSHIINLHNISRYDNSSRAVVVMSDGKEIPISRQKKEKFNMLIGNV